MEKVWWRGVAYKVSAGGIVELIEKTDATADFRRDVNADVGAAVDVAIDASEMRP